MVLAYALSSGLTTGALYALVAVGLVLCYRTTGHMNFSHGELFMIGGFLAYTFHVMLGAPYIPSLLLAVLGTFVLGLVTDRTVYRPLIHAQPLAMVMATVGFSFLLKGIGRHFWGGQGEVVTFPSPVSPAPVWVLGTPVFPQQLLVIAGVAVCMVLLIAFFQFTRAGKSMQATAENPHAAYLVGMRVERIYALTWGTSAALAGVAAVLMAPLTLLTPDVGFILLLKAFAATILGGLGSMAGAIVGGLILGVLEALAGTYIHSSVQEVSAFVIIMVVLVVRPSGLFGARGLRRV
ncbi:MAG: branched-chain amino acid ABC transporter permease [Alphaproteobacteria bacterium]|nr:branched-chain amino acid ABC transporter permease [Alphaproteobacteria bacterium]MDX5368898.1 branched-chain amino acid ABC transporter permease [Alphaproteobacteria bacterium]MDX5463622.1 branched-chain amino acid ABC transporter permease [Alphaproteobacteria bacterium]